ncbi:MAG TPA: aspartate aminotransferase family protein [Candidatus Angelobacter sp.]|nr:aspartate aminotransferase family protein [Candidatus Angelobacter sp.]
MSLPKIMSSAPDRAGKTAGRESYSDHVNPQWVRLLSLLNMNVSYARCSGAELFTQDGDRILDFLSGYCVHNLGHNHPAVISALHSELDQSGPAMLQSHVPESAGDLAAGLCRAAGGRLNKVYFCSSGSEGVETVIKFARVHTRRSGLLYCRGAFHGLTCGALSLMADSSWAQGFAPLLPGAESIPFDNLAELEKKLASKAFAAFIVEPIQSEAGVRVPGEGYLKAAQNLCHKYGTLFVLDEVQTALHRTGPFLAAHRWRLSPDMVVLAKALSGGLIPSGAVLMSDEIYESVYNSLGRAIIHTSTYSENGLAMRAGLATLQVLEDEDLGTRAEVLGNYLRQRLTDALNGYEMVANVRGVGLLNGIEFRSPEQLKLKIPFEAFRKIHAGMFGQIIVMKLFREKNVLTQICGNNFMVLKAAPPLVVNEDQIDQFVDAVKDVVEMVHSSGAFWRDALRLAQRAVNI